MTTSSTSGYLASYMRQSAAMVEGGCLGELRVGGDGGSVSHRTPAVRCASLSRRLPLLRPCINRLRSQGAGPRHRNDGGAGEGGPAALSPIAVLHGRTAPCPPARPDDACGLVHGRESSSADTHLEHCVRREAPAPAKQKRKRTLRNADTHSLGSFSSRLPPLPPYSSHNGHRPPRSRHRRLVGPPRRRQEGGPGGQGACATVCFCAEGDAARAALAAASHVPTLAASSLLRSRCVCAQRASSRDRGSTRALAVARPVAPPNPTQTLTRPPPLPPLLPAPSAGRQAVHDCCHRVHPGGDPPRVCAGECEAGEGKRN